MENYKKVGVNELKVVYVYGFILLKYRFHVRITKVLNFEYLRRL